MELKLFINNLAIYVKENSESLTFIISCFVTGIGVGLIVLSVVSYYKSKSENSKPEEPEKKKDRYAVHVNRYIDRPHKQHSYNSFILQREKGRN